MKTTTYVLATLLCTGNFSAQRFESVYPIGDNPSVAYKTSLMPSIEKILFEANPNLKLPIFNNIHERMMDGQDLASTLYLNFRLQIRMYDDASKPVKTPSYRIGLAYQRIAKLKNDQYLTWAVESGHFSNGQSKCAFHSDLTDGGEECNILCFTISRDPNSNLSEMLNRDSGNFSTNYTQLFLNHRLVLNWDENMRPTSSYSFLVVYTLFHNNLFFALPIGGFSETDIKIYGRHRFSASVDYMKKFSSNSLWKKISFDRYNLSITGQYISKPHPWVKPVRVVGQAAVYFKNNLGLFISLNVGHDDYNYRFVDRGTQFSAGMTFDIFPPIEMKGVKDD